MKKMMIAAAALVLLTGTALAQGTGGWGGPGGGRFSEGPGQRQFGGIGMEHLERFRMMFRGLGLSEEQQEEIRSIVEDARERVMDIMRSAGPDEERTTFMELFTSPVLTVRDLEESMSGMDRVRDDIRGIVLQAIVDVHDVLTAEQLRELAEADAEHHPHGTGGPGAGPMR